MFSIEALQGSHDRSQFDCGSEALDRYIRWQASQDARRNVTRVFVALPEESNEIAGFYALVQEVSNETHCLRRKRNACRATRRP